MFKCSTILQQWPLRFKKTHLFLNIQASNEAQKIACLSLINPSFVTRLKNVFKK